MPNLNSFYDSGVCPDCHLPIDNEAEEGQDCPNCGHVFWLAYENDDVPGEDSKPVGM